MASLTTGSLRSGAKLIGVFILGAGLAAAGAEDSTHTREIIRETVIQTPPPETIYLPPLEPTPTPTVSPSSIPLRCDTLESAVQDLVNEVRNLDALAGPVRDVMTRATVSLSSRDNAALNQAITDIRMAYEKLGDSAISVQKNADNVASALEECRQENNP